MTETNFDYASWQARLGLTTKEAAEALDISVSMLSALKRDGKGRKLYAWAAWGIERAAMDAKAAQEAAQA
jgi:hypothetical protein